MEPSVSAAILNSEELSAAEFSVPGRSGISVTVDEMVGGVVGRAEGGRLTKRQHIWHRRFSPSPTRHESAVRAGATHRNKRRLTQNVSVGRANRSRGGKRLPSDRGKEFSSSIPTGSTMRSRELATASNSAVYAQQGNNTVGCNIPVVCAPQQPDPAGNLVSSNVGESQQIHFSFSKRIAFQIC